MKYSKNKNNLSNNRKYRHNCNNNTGVTKTKYNHGAVDDNK